MSLSNTPNNKTFRKGHRRTPASADILAVCNVPRIPSLYTTPASASTSDSEDGGESYPTTPYSDTSFNLTIVSRAEAPSSFLNPRVLVAAEKVHSRELGSVLVHSVPASKKRFRRIVEETAQQLL